MQLYYINKLKYFWLMQRNGTQEELQQLSQSTCASFRINTFLIQGTRGSLKSFLLVLLRVSNSLIDFTISGSDLMTDISGALLRDGINQIAVLADIEVIFL